MQTELKEIIIIIIITQTNRKINDRMLMQCDNETEHKKYLDIFSNGYRRRGNLFADLNRVIEGSRGLGKEEGREKELQLKV